MSERFIITRFFVNESQDGKFFGYFSFKVPELGWTFEDWRLCKGSKGEFYVGSPGRKHHSDEKKYINFVHNTYDFDQKTWDELGDANMAALTQLAVKAYKQGGIDPTSGGTSGGGGARSGGRSGGGRSAPRSQAAPAARPSGRGPISRQRVEDVLDGTDADLPF